MNLSRYKILLQTLRDANYVSEKFNSCIQKNQQNPYLLLRHDVDFSLESALVLAQIEKELELQSTFFIQLRSPIYNLFDPNSIEIVKNIFELDHDIAMHINLSDYDANYEFNILNDLKIAKQLFHFINDQIISFHQPGKQLDLISKLYFSNRIRHTYEREFIKEIGYLSDSKGVWRFGHPLESQVFVERKDLHLLIHPIWWVFEGNSPVEKIKNFVMSKDVLIRKSIAESVVSFDLNW